MQLSHRYKERTIEIFSKLSDLHDISSEFNSKGPKNQRYSSNYSYNFDYFLQENLYSEDKFARTPEIENDTIDILPTFSEVSHIFSNKLIKSIWSNFAKSGSWNNINFTTK